MKMRDQQEGPELPPGKTQITMGEYFSNKNARRFVTRAEMANAVTHMIRNAHRHHSWYWRCKAYWRAQWQRLRGEVRQIVDPGTTDAGGE